VDQALALTGPFHPTVTMRNAIICLAALVVACAPAQTTTADPSAPRVQEIRAEGLGGSLKIASYTDPATTPIGKGALDAFQLMPLVYDSLQIPKTWLDPKQFLVSSQGFKIRARLGRTPLSRFIDCGKTQIGPNADSYEVFMTVTSKLIPNGDVSTLNTTVEASARPVSFNQAYSRCSSTGTLEKRISDLLLSLLAK
jgi:hypothetical protein